MFTYISSDVVVVSAATGPNFDSFTNSSEFQYAFNMFHTSGYSFGGTHGRIVSNIINATVSALPSYIWTPLS